MPFTRDSSRRGLGDPAFWTVKGTARCQLTNPANLRYFVRSSLRSTPHMLVQGHYNGPGFWSVRSPREAPDAPNSHRTSDRVHGWTGTQRPGWTEPPNVKGHVRHDPEPLGLANYSQCQLRAVFDRQDNGTQSGTEGWWLTGRIYTR
jgi:hypothetical protein